MMEDMDILGPQRAAPRPLTDLELQQQAALIAARDAIAESASFPMHWMRRADILAKLNAVIEAGRR